MTGEAIDAELDMLTLSSEEVIEARELPAWMGLGARVGERFRHIAAWTRVFCGNLWFALKRNAFVTGTSYDNLRLTRSRLLVRRLLKRKVSGSDESDVRNLLSRYLYTKSWADRSEVFNTIKAATTAVIIMVVSAFTFLNELTARYCVQLYKITVEKVQGQLRVWRPLPTSPTTSADWIPPPDFPSLASVARSRSMIEIERRRSVDMERGPSRREPAAALKQDTGRPPSSHFEFPADSDHSRSSSQRKVVRQYRRRVFVAGKDLLMSTARCAWAILWMMCILVKQVFVYVSDTIRGRKNRFAIFELWGDADFSQRVIVTMLVSLFMTGLVAVFITVIFSWSMAYVYDAICVYEDALDQTKILLDTGLVWPPSMTRYSLLSRVLYTLSGATLGNLRDSLHHKTFDLIFAHVVPPAIGGLAGLCWLGMLFAWVLMLKQYRADIFAGRRGVWRFDPNSVNVMNSSKLVGYQAIHCVVGYFGIFVISFLVVLFIVLLIFVKGLAFMVFSYGHGLILRVIFSSVFLSFIITQASKLIAIDQFNGHRNMVYSAMMDFTLMVTSMILGALVVLKRALMLFVKLLMSFWRLDKHWMPSDSGHGAWCAMVVQDCRQTNPVMLVFCQLMFDTINARRAMADRPRHVDEDYVTCPIPLFCCLPVAPCLHCCYRGANVSAFRASDRRILDDCEPEDTPNFAKLRWTKRDAPDKLFTMNPVSVSGSGSGVGASASTGSSTIRAPSAWTRPTLGSDKHHLYTTMSPEATANFERYRHRQRVINRWWLLLVMSKNPSLKFYRKSRATVQLAPRVLSMGCLLHGFVRISSTGFAGRWSSPKTRYLILKHDHLVFYQTLPGTRVPHGTIALVSARALVVPEDRQECLHVETEARTFRIEFAGPEERDLWESTIRGTFGAGANKPNPQDSQAAAPEQAEDCAVTVGHHSV